MRIVLFLLMLWVTLSQAQETPLKDKAKALQAKIADTEGPEKIRLLDSLTLLVRNQTALNYDSIARYTIDYALKYQEPDIADKHLAFLIFYFSNRQGKPQEGVALFENFKQRTDTTQQARILGELYLNAADSYYYIGQTEKAITIYEMAEAFGREAGEQGTVGAALEYRADAHADLGAFAKATELLQEAERIYKAIKDTTRQILTQNSRANLYSQNGFFEEAQKEREEVIAKAEKASYYPALLSALYNSAIDDGQTGNYKRRIANLKKALVYTRQSEFVDLYEPRLLNSLLQSYSKTDSLERADAILKELESNPERNTQGVFKTMHTTALSEYYLAKGNYKDALTYGERYLESQEQSKNVVNLVGAHEFLANLYETLGNDDRAFYHYKTFTQIQDSINSVQKVNSLSYYQTLYETEKRDAQIQKQQTEIALLDAKNKVKTQWFLFGGIGVLAIFTVLWLLRSRGYARKRQVMQTDFSQKLIQEQEKERSRVARELHDSVGQKLMLLSRKTKTAGDQDMEELTTDTLDELRTILKGLQPAVLEKLGPAVAIQSLVNEVDANTDIFFTTAIGPIDTLLTKETALHLYRIIQEALNNIVKHAEAKAVSITITKESDSIKTVIKDNGVGFNYSKKYLSEKNLGMKTLLERAKIINSKIEIDSTPGKGTTITLSIPT